MGSIRHRLHWLAFAQALCLCATVHGQIFTASDNIVVFEAESFTQSIARNSRNWAFTNAVSAYSGTGYMEVSNSSINAFSNISSAVAADSPELQYGVQFTNGATYQVWARVYGSNVTEDSIHIGMDGVWTNAGSNLNWGTYGSWVWTNGGLAGAVRTVTVPSAGLHTFNLWMREDGARVDRFALATDAAFKPTTGNSFHLPFNSEPDLPHPTMRYPFGAIFSNTTVDIYNGNQFRGAGNPGNQLGIGSAVLYKAATNSTWTEVAMNFFAQGAINTNNKYFVGSIPGGTFNAGDVVQYYLRIPYSDHLPTFLYGTDDSRSETEIESIAQSNPYTFTVESSYLSISNLTPSGYVEARLFTNSGSLQVVGPDLSGNPLTNIIDILAAARIGGTARHLGAILSATPYSNGFEMVQQLDTGSVTSRLTFLAEGVARYEVVNWGGLAVDQSLVKIPSDITEHFFGLGEKFNSVDQSGHNVRILTWDPAGTKNDDSYKCAPWFMSTRGYGFHLDSSAQSYFDLRARSDNGVVVSNLHPSLQFNVVYGPRLTSVLTRYTDYAGRPYLPPTWVFAPWMSSDIWSNGGQIRFLLQKYREQGLAGSALVFDSPWETAYNDFNWNMTQWATNGTYEGTNYAGFSSSASMMTYIRTNGFKAIMWMTPFVNKSSNQDVPGITNGYASNYAQGSNLGYFVRSATNGPPLLADWWKGQGSPVDYTYPAAAQWLQAQLSNLVAQSGGVIGGFKTDDGETSNGSDTYIPTTAIYSNGLSGVEMRNGYCVSYHRAVSQVLGTGGVLFARSGFTGSHAFPGYWAGDNAQSFDQGNGLQSVIVAGQSAGLSGFSIWAHDIGGYQATTSTSPNPTNLFMRWAQFGTFSPIFQMHRKIESGKQYPWSFGTPALDNFRFYAALHQSLFPYIYTYAQEATEDGLPILRHPVLLNQTDTNVFGINHSYYFGDAFFVAPANAESQTIRSLYLPPGNWNDYWTNRTYVGGQVIAWTNTDQARMAIFVRSGAIIPRIPTNVLSLCDASYISNSAIATWDGTLDFLAYPSNSMSGFNLYDGSTALCLSNGTVTTFTLTSSARPIRLHVRGNLPAGVERNGIRLTKYTNAAQFAAASLGWSFDAAGEFVDVKYTQTNGSTTVRFGPDSVGDGISDSWRLDHFGAGSTTDEFSCAACDADGDGLSNSEEYGAGTDPNESNSVFRVQDQAKTVVSSTNNLVISWQTAPGIPYKIEWKNDVADSVLWNTLATQFTGDGSVTSWYDNGADTGTPPDQSPTGRRFYRLIVP